MSKILPNEDAKLDQVKRRSQKRGFQITQANKEKNARAAVTYFASANSTVYISGLRFSRDYIVFAKSCFEIPKIIIFSIFKIK